MNITGWLVLWSLWAARFVHQPTIPVYTQGGWLRGIFSPGGCSKQYLAIPYATIPENRFQAPGLAPTWRGIFNAVEEYIRCPQRFLFNIVMGQADCLILNVYTPADAASSSRYPVMALIHGGGFYEGSSTRFVYGEDYLMNKKVVLVTFNYRLQIHGNLCLRIKEAPGNAGMKDQVAALKWIQRNIKAFGGDPDNVTIFGISVGSTSVSYHMISPMSKGLFHKAIMQSSSGLEAWSLQHNPLQVASSLAQHMGHNTRDPHELYNIFSQKTDEELILSRVPRQEGSNMISEVNLVPCVENKIQDEEAFLTDSPYNLLSRGEYKKVPIIIGHCIEEGLYFVSQENNESLSKLRFETFILNDTMTIRNVNIRKDIGVKLQKVCMGNKNISSDTLGNLSRLYGEVYFTFPVVEATELYWKRNDIPVYSYIFKYDGWRNIVKFTALSFSLWRIPGATHADDLFYLFSQPIFPTLFENKMINRMTTMWTNFAKYGNPTPELSDLIPVKWTPSSKSTLQSLIIDEEFSLGPLHTSEIMVFLRDLYRQYRETNSSHNT